MELVSFYIQRSRKHCIWNCINPTASIWRCFRDFNHLQPSAMILNWRPLAEICQITNSRGDTEIESRLFQSNRKLFRFCLSLRRASHSNLHPTEEVLLCTHFLHHASALSVFSIDFINASVWYQWLSRSFSSISFERRVSFCRCHTNQELGPHQNWSVVGNNFWLRLLIIGEKFLIETAPLLEVNSAPKAASKLETSFDWNNRKVTSD